MKSWIRKSTDSIVGDLNKEIEKYGDKLAKIPLEDNVKSFYILGILSGLRLALDIIRGKK